MKRREFLVGCSAAIAAMAGSRITGYSFTLDGSSSNETFIYIFLRGGCDGLNLVGPVNDSDYINERPSNLRILDSGDKAGLSLKNGLSNLDFRFHNKADALKELYDSNALAIVHAAGLTNGTRSHFDAQDFIERGSVDNKNLTEGWFTRYLKSTALQSDSKFNSMAMSGSLPASFLGSNNTIALTNFNGYKLHGDGQLNKMLRSFYNGNRLIDEVAIDTLDSIQFIQQKLSASNVPDVDMKAMGYGDDSFSKSLATLARTIKMDVGLQVASVDYGGWDTHEGQQGIFSNRVETLSNSLCAFYNDIANYQSKVTVLVMSEFGRRLKANKSGGTDHGHGNAMLVLGGNVNGGKMYGKWPGLSTDQLDNHVDLAVTTDYRTVLSEILVRRMQNNKLGYIFPGVTEYNPLGLMHGNDLKIDYALK